MKAKRRYVRPVDSLEEMTDRELVKIRFFGTHPSYVVQPGDDHRATELLRERGYYRREDNPPRVP